MELLSYLKEINRRLSINNFNGIESYLMIAFDEDNYHLIEKSKKVGNLRTIITLTGKIINGLTIIEDNFAYRKFIYRGFQQRNLTVKRLLYLQYKYSKIKKTFIRECKAQKFFPLFVNTLHYEGSQGYLTPVTVTLSANKHKEGFNLQFKHNESFKVAMSRAIISVKNRLSEPERQKLNKLNISFHAMQNFYGDLQDKPFSGSSIGLAMAVAIYFNFHLLCCTSAKRRESMRRLFEKELSNIAFTGEIKDGGEIGSVGGLSKKIEAAENMGMKRVFCPVANKDEIKGKSLSIIPVKNLEQAITLVRYEQYLEKIRKEDESKRPLVEERGFDEIVKKSHLDSMTIDIADGARNPIKQIDVMNKLDRGIIVTGNGGIGKTTFLKYLRWYYSNKILDGESIDEFKGSIKIPVFIDLRNYKTGKDIYELLRTSIIKECEDYDYLNPSDIEDELEAGGFLILCDGIDGIDREVLNDAEKEIQYLINEYPENYLAFSSRESAYLGFIPNIQQVELKGLTKDNIEAIIDKEFERDSERGSKLKELLEKNPLEIEGNPFFLSLIIEDVKNYPDMEIDISRFRNIGKLFERIVSGRYEKESTGEATPHKSEEKKLIKAFKEFMPGFAAYLWTEGKKSFIENDIKVYSKRVNKTPTNFIECLNNPMVIPLLELISDDYWGFIHDRFFEYFAGVHLRDEFLKIVSETGMEPTPTLIDYLQEYVNMMKWENIISNTAGLLVDCEVEKGKIYCKCNQDGFFCTSQKGNNSCERFSIIQDTYQLSRK